MITNIDRKIENGHLIVEVTCAPRKFANKQIKLLTTNNLIDILIKKHKINVKETIEEPSHEVGNTTRRNIKSNGRWVFSIDIEKEQKPKAARTKKTATKSPRKKSSIRTRMSALKDK